MLSRILTPRYREQPPFLRRYREAREPQYVGGMPKAYASWWAVSDLIGALASLISMRAAHVLGPLVLAGRDTCSGHAFGCRLIIRWPFGFESLPSNRIPAGDRADLRDWDYNLEVVATQMPQILIIRQLP